MRANAPAKTAAKAEKVGALAAEKAERAALRAAAAEEKRTKDALERAARKLGGPAGPAGRNEAWEAEVEEEHERCVAACDAEKAEKLAKGRAAYKRTRKVKATNGVAGVNNTGVSLSDEEAWTMFTDDLPADIKAFVSTDKQKSSLIKSVAFKSWVAVYAGSTSKGKAELAKYRDRIKKAVGTKLKAAANAMAAVKGNGGASRKRRASHGGSRRRRSRRRN